MRPRTRARLVAPMVAIVGVLALGLTLPARAIGPADCGSGDAALHAGHLVIAREIFSALAAVGTTCVEPGDSSTAAASTGLDRVDQYARVAADLAKTGDDYLRGSSPDKAAAAYNAALLFDDANAGAVAGLKALQPKAEPTPTPTPTPVSSIDVANAMAKAGLKDDAKTEYAKALEADPNASAGAELQALTKPDQFADWTTPLQSISTLATALFSVLAFVLFIWVVVPRLALSQRVFWAPPRLVIDAPVDAGESKRGDHIVSAIRKELDDMASDRGGRRLELATLPDDQIDLPDTLATKFPEAQLAADLLAMLGARTESISTTILASTDRGAGLSVAHKDKKGQLRGSVEIWENWLDPRWKATADKTDPGAYRRLAIAASAWVAYTTVTSDGEGSLKRLSTNWRSYALTRIGADWQLSRDNARARELYAQALDLDPDNPGALNNLGRLDLETSEGESEKVRLERAITRLARAKWKSGRERATIGPDRNWYRAAYNLGVAHLLLAMSEREAGHTEAAHEHYRAALDETGNVLKASSSQLLGTIHISDDMRAFLRLVTDAGALMLADVLAQAGSALTGTEGTKTYADPDRLIAEFPYLIPSSRSRHHWPNPASILATYCTIGDRLPSRVRYNLACLLTTFMEPTPPATPPVPAPTWEAALRELRGALENGSPVAWPERDPSLKKLQTAKNEDFQRVIALAPASTAPDTEVSSNAAKLSLVGAIHSDVFSGRGIFEPKDLVAATEVDGGVAKLADACGVHAGLVTRWHMQARIATLQVGDQALGVEKANLLADAGFASPTALAGADPEALTILLGDVNKGTKRLTQAPGRADVDAWQAAAKADLVGEQRWTLRFGFFGHS